MSNAESQDMSNVLEPLSACDNRILKGPLSRSRYVHSLAPKRSSMLRSLTQSPGSLTPSLRSLSRGTVEIPEYPDHSLTRVPPFVPPCVSVDLISGSNNKSTIFRQLWQSQNGGIYVKVKSLILSPLVSASRTFPSVRQLAGNASLPSRDRILIHMNLTISL